jgi:hypothetical protein
MLSRKLFPVISMAVNLWSVPGLAQYAPPPVPAPQEAVATRTMQQNRAVSSQPPATWKAGTEVARPTTPVAASPER